MSGELKLRRDAVEWREVEGQIAALDLDARTYVAVNRTGTVLWKELAAGSTHQALVSRLAEAYGLEADIARRDVDAFLDRLLERNLLEGWPTQAGGSAEHQSS